MGRVSSQLYLDRCCFLRHAWLYYQNLFAVLPAHQQWQLHAFYQPDHDWTTEQLLEHRRVITKQQPSLPNRTGKLFRRLDRVFRIAFKHSKGDEQRFLAVIHLLASPPVDDHGRRRTKVYAVVRPEIDSKRIARALLEFRPPGV